MCIGVHQGHELVPAASTAGNIEQFRVTVELNALSSSASSGTTGTGNSSASTPWILDTGANCICTSPEDPCIVKLYESETVPLGTTAGNVSAKRAMIQTPYGTRRGLVVPGSPRLLPGYMFDVFRQIRRVCQGGVCFDVVWKDNVPVVSVTAGGDASGTPVSVSTVSLRPHSVTSRKRRKLAAKLRKRYKISERVEDEDWDLPPVKGDVTGPSTPTCPVCTTPSGVRNVESEDSGSPGTDVVRTLDFDDVNCYSCLFTSVKAQAYASALAVNELTHLHCSCEFCKIANTPFAPQKRKVGGWTPKYSIGDLIVGDLCTDWSQDRLGNTVALIMRDVSSGLRYVRPLKSKVPEGVKEGLTEFREMLLSMREYLKLPKPHRPWIYHCDRGGEFEAKRFETWVAENGGTVKYAPKGAHVGAAEQAVRHVLQGTRVALYAAGLTVRYWSYAARQHVHNGNLEMPGFKQFLEHTGRPYHAEVFGRLCFFKPQKGDAPPKGENTSYPAAFLGFDPCMTQGAWVLFSKNEGKSLSVTSVKLGTKSDEGSASGLVWSKPQSDGRTTMAYKRIIQDLKEICVQNKGAIENGHPGMTAEEMSAWLLAHPVPMRYIEAMSSCPACRGKHEAHTWANDCYMRGITESQARHFGRWKRGKGVEEQKAYLKELRAKNAKTLSAEQLAKVRGGVDSEESEGDEAVFSTRAFDAVKKKWLVGHGTTKSHSAFVASLPSEYDMCGAPHSTCGCKAGLCSFYSAHVDSGDDTTVPGSPRESEADSSSDSQATCLMRELGKGILECSSQETHIQTCLNSADSPVQFRQRSAVNLLEREYITADPVAIATHTFEYLEDAPGYENHFFARVTRKMTRQEREGAGAAAIQLELDRLVEHGLFSRPVSSAQMLREKPDTTYSGVAMLAHVKHAERSVESQKFKGRMVVLGDNVKNLSDHRPAVMPSDVPVGEVASLDEVRCVAGYAVMAGLNAECVDIQNAYLTAPMRTLEGRDINHGLYLPKAIWSLLPSWLHPSKDCREPIWPMARAGYGHPVSGHLFIGRLREYLLKIGFRKIEGSCALFKRGSVLIAVYVDDIVGVGESSELASFWEQLGEQFRFSAEPEECSEFLGISFKREDTDTHNVYKLSLGDYVRDTVRLYESMWKAKVTPSLTPGTENIRTAHPDMCSVERSQKDLQCLIGRILWICRTTRPEVAEKASAYGSRILTWGSDCEKELAKTIGYLASTPDAALEFRWPKHKPTHFFNSIHTDADWAVPRSQSGFISFFSCSSQVEEEGREDSVEGFVPLYFGSKKQPLTADSSTSAEVISVHYGIRQSYGIMSSFGEFLKSRDILPGELLVKVRIDNHTALAYLSKFPTDTFYIYSKAINVRIGLLRDLVLAKLIDVGYVSTNLNRGDSFTKGFSGPVFPNKARLCGIVYSVNCLVSKKSMVARKMRGVLWKRANMAVQSFVSA